MIPKYANFEGTKSDWISFLTSYQNNSAIFFTEEGVLVNKKTKNPITSFQKTLEELNITVCTLHLLNSTVILKCELPFPNEKLDELNYQVVPVKSYLSTINFELQKVILKAYHWVQWDVQSKFCGNCGHLLKSMVRTTEKKCHVCDCSFFPRFSPAVIVLVVKKNQILLARSSHFPTEVYSAIAGFVDIGETAEMAVQRELKEEVGIEVKNIKYISSQTWPFPDSFMIAFKADHSSGDIVLDKEEIEDARWFNINSLPKLPERVSISRKLIDFVLGEMTME